MLEASSLLQASRLNATQKDRIPQSRSGTRTWPNF